MNGHQRRASARFKRRVRALQQRVEASGRPGVIYGLTDACRDCRGGGELHLYPGGAVLGRVFHDPGCPAGSGATTWAPCPGGAR